MKYIFQFWSATPHLETSLEIAIEQSLQGESIHYFWGGDDVLFNEDNRSGNLGNIFAGQKPVVRGLNAIERRFGNLFDYHADWVRYSQSRDYSYQTLDELLDIRLGAYELGRAAVSSLSFVLRTNIFSKDIIVFKPMIDEILVSGAAVYDSAKEIISQANIEEVIFFNGRFVHEAAILGVCRESNTPFRLHERGSSPDKYSITDYLVHDRKAQYSHAIMKWEEDKMAGKPVENIATEYLDARIKNGFGGHWVSYSAGFDRSADIKQVRGQLGVETDAYWVFFQSSNDEYAAIDPSLVEDTEWLNQEELVQFIASVLPNDITLLVRIHPHMAKKNPDDLNSWKLLEQKFNSENARVKFVWSDSNVNSYLLADHAETVISCGSTLGLESIYLGAKSICCGSSVWGFLENVPQVFTFDALVRCLEVLEKCDPQEVLPIAYFWADRGRRFKYFENDGLFAGRFLGKDIFNSKEFF